MPPESSSQKELTYPEQPSGYMVRHNDTIVGIFSDEVDANAALHEYETKNNIQLDDILDIIRVI